MRLSCLIAVFWLLAAAALPGFASDPVTELREKVRKGEVRLEFDGERGYLPSLLKALSIPISSQTLVFSKTSFQSEHISPSTPRALYFNDNVYAGWVRGSSAMELISVDPAGSAAFYLVGRGDDGKPIFERSTGHDCSVCHYSQESKTFVPQLSFLSVIPDATGNVEGAFPIPTDDGSPFPERWGGWYVTGTHGAQRHAGNIWNTTPAAVLANVSGTNSSKSQNVVDLKDRFDASAYLSPHSDIVALCVMAHQIEIQNLISLAAANRAKPPDEIGERLVKAMLFSGAAQFTSPIRGTSGFAVEFTAQGPKDTRGRSLRDLDLQTRLFRYPLSYMIYTEPFQGLAEPIKAYVGKRLKEVLSGTDHSPAFAHLSGADRTAILEILRDTKPLPGF
jgi:hypothetical protein